MQMVQKMDAGPIFAQKKVEILPTDNASSLFEKMGDAASSLLKENLEEPFELADKLYIDETFNLLKTRASFKEKIIEAKSLAYKNK